MSFGFLHCSKKLKPGAKWHTFVEVKPKRRYTCGWCGSRSMRPYRWVDGAKSCQACNIAYKS